MIACPSFSYDQVPYPALSHSSTHPDSLATLAALAGMPVAQIDRCRVLELGAASGGNLIPMAYGLPGSEFVGIDLSQKQIAEGQQKVEALGLKNLQLIAMNILELSPELGSFDYIIAHGVFSWVPRVVQDKLLDIYRDHLAPNGVGFISYNTYPGWHMINIARDIMRFATQGITDPVKRVEEARKAIRYFADAHNGENDGYFGFLKMYSNSIDGKGETPVKYDSALLHDELEDLNQPFYFHEFVERAEQHDLQFLGDLCEMRGDSIPPDTLAELRKKSHSLVELEQYCDFMLRRTFRKTLVCHKEVVLDRKVTTSRLQKFFISSQAQPVSESPNLNEVNAEKFVGLDGGTLNINHPLSKMAMVCLAEAWPRALPFDELFSRAQARLVESSTRAADQANEAMDAQVLGANLFKAYSYSQSLVELHLAAPPVTNQVEPYPVASRIARYEVLHSGPITNLRHERVVLEEMERFILPFLNGKNDREALICKLIEGPLAEGAMTLEKDGALIPLSEQRASLEKELDHSLEWLAQAGMLVDTTRLGE